MIEPDRLPFLRDVSLADVESVGGKAAALGEIEQAGCLVPPGFVVPRSYRERDRDGRLDPHAFELDVRRRCEAVGTGPFAVRSSGVAEDGMEASWAGQFSTFLNVGSTDVTRRIRDCWLSPGSVHASAYAERHDALDRRWELAVVVQVMIAADISGVLFTVDPVSKDPRLSALEAVAGLGEPLVQGTVTPESYVLDRRTGEVADEHRSEQRTALRMIDGDLREVPLVRGPGSLVTEKMLGRLLAVGRRLEGHFGSPQDIEWTISEGTLWVVQSRPITTL